MTQPRCTLVDPLESAFYHCHSRCVRRVDLLKSRTRQVWLIERLAFLADCFAIDVCEYAVMSNHLHLILRTQPDLARAWTECEVAERWMLLRGRLHDADGCLREKARDTLASNEPRIDELRARLGGLEWFHRELKTPCSRRWNREDDVTGHFWQGRYGSVIAESDVSLVNQAIYVLLNHIRSGAEDAVGASESSSMGRRIEQLTREILEGRHGDALAAFENRFARAQWTPVFPCEPGSARELDDATFANLAAEGRQRYAVRAEFARRGRERVFLAADARVEDLAPFVVPGGVGTDAQRGSETGDPPIPQTRLRPRPSLEQQVFPRRSATDWVTVAHNPFGRSRIGRDGAVPLVPGLKLEHLVRLIDEEGRQVRPDKPGRIAPSSPDTMVEIRRRVCGTHVTAASAEDADGGTSAGHVPLRAAEPVHRTSRDDSTSTVTRLTSALRSLFARQREVLAKFARAGRRVVWDEVRRATTAATTAVATANEVPSTTGPPELSGA